MNQLLILMKGHPGAGKSEIARALGRILACPVIDKDDVRDWFWTYDDVDGKSGRYAYDAMWQLAKTQLNIGLSVICDSPLSEDIGYQAGLSLAVRYDVKLLVIECICTDNQEWRQRIESRNGVAGHNIVSWDQLQELLARYGNRPYYRMMPEHLVQVDTAQPFETCMRSVLDKVEEVNK